MLSWDLFREMEQLHRDIDDVFRGAGLGREFSPGRKSIRHFPRINLREDDDFLYVEALLPGVDPKQVDINMLGNTLTLSGERRGDDDEANSRTWHRRERVQGRFLRTLELPVQVDVEKAKAEYKHGLLRVSLPKAATAKPKSIDIQVH
jgi:HSP20 family protein